MGKALSGELSCPCDRSCFVIASDIFCRGKIFGFLTAHKEIFQGYTVSLEITAKERHTFRVIRNVGNPYIDWASSKFIRTSGFL